MIELGSRARSQAPPPRVVFEAIVHPDLDPARPWLKLLCDEIPPRVLESEAPHRVIWSSLWQKLPGAQIRFDLSPHGQGTTLRWTLLAPEAISDEAFLGHVRKRMNQLINADLRFTFGQ